MRTLGEMGIHSWLDHGYSFTNASMYKNIELHTLTKSAIGALLGLES